MSKDEELLCTFCKILERLHMVHLRRMFVENIHRVFTKNILRHIYTLSQNHGAGLLCKVLC
jgi:hypothetical protein